jgi:RimJ/RimL family protein N-acetyltransferase
MNGVQLMNPVVPLALDTPRLRLRMFEEHDCDALHEMFGDEACVRYTIEQPLAPWQTWRALAAYLGHWQLRGYGPYAVVERSTGTMMGPVGLWFPIEWPEPEIKWSLARRFWGFGFATEAATAVRDMAAVVLRRSRLVSVIRPENTRSQAVARRLGGVYEKTTPFRGGMADVYAYDLRARFGVPATHEASLCGPHVPPWVPAEASAEIDLSELAAEVPEVREQCARLGALFEANVAAYRRDAQGRPGGLCSYYRAMSLTPAQMTELARAEHMCPTVLFVAYGEPLERQPIPNVANEKQRSSGSSEQ